MAILELPAHHRPLAAAILKRAVFDLTSSSRHSTDAWHWFFAESSAPQGWDFEDTARVLELSVPHLRKALERAGYDRPPIPYRSRQREKVPGLLPCRACGEATFSGDTRVQRTCPSCGILLKPKYLRRHGLLAYENGAKIRPRHYAVAALQQLLRHGPLPTTYVIRHLTRAGCARNTIARARLQLGVRATKLGHTQWVLSLPNCAMALKAPNYEPLSISA